jgi:hypothetical protein
MSTVIRTVIIMGLILTTMAVYMIFGGYNTEKMDIQYSLNLACREIVNSVSSKRVSVENIAFRRTYDIELDNTKLMDSFYNTLKLNIKNENNFAKLKENIVCKIVVLNDRFYVAGEDDKFKAPVFFSEYNDSLGEFLYYKINSEDTYYYSGSNKIESDLASHGVTNEEKIDFIIDRLNDYISRNTLSIRYGKDNKLEKYSIQIQVKNPEKGGGEYIATHRHFNILRGITFLVIYNENSTIAFRDMINFKSYNITGYTITKPKSTNPHLH